MDVRTAEGLEEWVGRIFDSYRPMLPILGPPNPMVAVMVTRDFSTKEPLDEPGFVLLTPQAPPSADKSVVVAALTDLRNQARRHVVDYDAVGVGVITTAVRHRDDVTRMGILLRVEHKLLGERMWLAEIDDEGKVGEPGDPWEGFELGEPLRKFLPASYMD